MFTYALKPFTHSKLKYSAPLRNNAFNFFFKQIDIKLIHNCTCMSCLHLAVDLFTRTTAIIQCFLLCTEANQNKRVTVEDVYKVLQD